MFFLHDPGNDILAKLSKLFGVTSDYFLCIDDRQFIEVTGLSERQIAHVEELINLLKASNNKQFSTMKGVI